AIHSAFRGVATLMVAAATGMAQTGGGATLVGTVKDATGATVGGAKVTVVNTATSFLTETTTSAEGAYYVPYLTPGDYRVKVSAAGFKEFVREGITLRSRQQGWPRPVAAPRWSAQLRTPPGQPLAAPR